MSLLNLSLNKATKKARPIMPTLGVLFVVTAGGQMLSAVSSLSGATASTARETVLVSPFAEGDAMSEAGATSDGIIIVDERDFDAPVKDDETEIRAQRYSLKKEALRLALEQEALEKKWALLDEKRVQQHRHLAQMYAQMPASKAAAILVKLKAKEAAIFVSLMPGDAGAKILASMPADSAVAITREVLARTSAL